MGHATRYTRQVRRGGEDFLYDLQGRTFGAPAGLTAPAVNSKDGREAM
jgi:hypothetical protein